MNPSANRLVTTLVLLIILGIVLQGLLVTLAHILPWLALGLLAAGLIFVTLRVLVTRSKHF